MGSVALHMVQRLQEQLLNGCIKESPSIEGLFIYDAHSMALVMFLAMSECPISLG